MSPLTAHFTAHFTCSLCFLLPVGVYRCLSVSVGCCSFPSAAHAIPDAASLPAVIQPTCRYPATRHRPATVHPSKRSIVSIASIVSIVLPNRYVKIFTLRSPNVSLFRKLAYLPFIHQTGH